RRKATTLPFCSRRPHARRISSAASCSSPPRPRTSASASNDRARSFRASVCSSSSQASRPQRSPSARSPRRASVLACAARLDASPPLVEAAEHGLETAHPHEHVRLAHAVAAILVQELGAAYERRMYRGRAVVEGGREAV